jgi:hypothetical protein
MHNDSGTNRLGQHSNVFSKGWGQFVPTLWLEITNEK